MKIAIASDHAGFELKKEIVDLLVQREVEVFDLGVEKCESVDYPDYGEKLARAVAVPEAGVKGILICGTGIGMSIVANKIAGIRAALVHDVFTAKMSRAHNDANVLVLGARVIPKEEIPKIVNAWLDEPFEGDRHAKRIEKITRLDKEK